MKKICSIILVLTFVFTFTACGSSKACKHNWERTANRNEYTAMDKCTICGVTRMYTNPDNPPPASDELGVKMLRYAWDDYGIGQKEIYSCDLGYAIIDCLSKLTKTGETAAKISDDEVNMSSGKLPVTPGTVWLECGSVGLFRLNPQMNEICKVQTHLGEGAVLQMTDTLEELLRQAWYYHPNDYWSGEYENGAVSLHQLYKANSAVDWVSIDNIHIENKIDSESNKITLCICANESKQVKVSLQSYQSNDNLGTQETKELDLVKGDEACVDFKFKGFYNSTYRVKIKFDNTIIVLNVNPQNTN